MFSLLGPLHYPWVLSVVFKCFANTRITFQIAFLCVHVPRGHIFLRFLPPPPRPPPLSDKNPVMLHFFAYAKIIFAHILVFPACAIEVQHIDENSPTILVSRTVRSSNCCIFEMKGASGLETCTKIYFLFIFNLMYIRIRKTSLL